MRVREAMVILGLVVAPAACGESSKEVGSTKPASSASEDVVEASGEVVPPQPLLKDLGPAGRRMDVLVLPGDASVEVDGRPARRRDGVVELVGRVGEARLLRVSRGAEFMEQRVTIADTAGTPLVVKLVVNRAARPGGATPGASNDASAEPRNGADEQSAAA